MSTTEQLNLAYKEEIRALMNRMRGNKETRDGRRNYAQKIRKKIKPRGKVFDRLDYIQWYATSMASPKNKT